MSIVMSNINARLDYDVALKSLAAQGINVDPSVAEISQSYLRTEVQLNPSKSSYSFPINEQTNNTGQNIPVTSQLLKPQDVFYLTHMAYWIELASITGAATPDLYRYQPFTYPSEQLNRTGAVLSKLGYKLWAGKFIYTVSGKVVLPAWDMKRHLYVPEEQVEAVNGAFPVGQFYTDHDEFDGAVSGFYPVEPNLILIGNKGNEFKAEFPEDLNNAIGSTANYDIRMVVTMRGLLVQNASKTA